MQYQEVVTRPHSLYDRPTSSEASAPLIAGSRTDLNRTHKTFCKTQHTQFIGGI